jgi:hypothetical protein
MRRFALVWQRLHPPLEIAAVIERVEPVVPVAFTYTPEPKGTEAEV